MYVDAFVPDSLRRRQACSPGRRMCQRGLVGPRTRPTMRHDSVTIMGRLIVVDCEAPFGVGAPSVGDMTEFGAQVVEADRQDGPRGPAPAVGDSEDDAATAVYWREERVQRGDTIGSLLARAGVDDADAMRFLRTSTDARPLYQLRPGRPVRVAMDANGALVALTFRTGADDTFAVERAGDGFRATTTAAATPSAGWRAPPTCCGATPSAGARTTPTGRRAGCASARGSWPT